MSAQPSRSKPSHTGGCQCGAVRFATFVEPARVGVCHCRMCQKAVAGPFGAYAVVPLAEFAWTRGQPAAWRSSSRAMRDFCPTCGTPLTFRSIGGATIELQTGAFDHPEKVAPTYEVGREGKLAWVSGIGGLPGKTTLENIGAEKLAGIESYQHPDHDTSESWIGPEVRGA